MLKNKSLAFANSNSYIIINKSIQAHLHETPTVDDEVIAQILNSLTQKENALIKFAADGFSNLILFPEILATQPEEHVTLLANRW